MNISEAGKRCYGSWRVGLCTNIIYPEISIINSIGYDHMNVLGNSLEEIAFQKAGIIKKNSATIYISQSESVDKVIKPAQVLDWGI